jgi:DNA-binding response OmpR family regulator
VARILCVDDDPAALSLKQEILEKVGHKVTISVSVESAVLQLHNRVFDAVVTDWRMGTQNGHSLLEVAKSGKGVPVIVVSGYVGEAMRGFEPFADIYLEKPVNPAELLQILDALLKSRLPPTHTDA